VYCELRLGGVELQAIGAGDEVALAGAGDGFDIFVADGCSCGVGGCSFEAVVADDACFGCCAAFSAARYLFGELET
jgi:hypothetical protein